MRTLKLLALWLLLSFGLTAHAQSTSADEEVMMKRAHEIGVFVKQNNAQGVVDYTDDAIKNFVGYKTFYAMTSAAMQALAEDGAVAKELQFEKPWPEIQGQSRVFRLIPKVQTMSMSNHTGRMNGFFLAVKNSDGVWKFVEGSGLVKHPKLTELLYPDIPKGTKFPEVKLEIIDGSE